MSTKRAEEEAANNAGAAIAIDMSSALACVAPPAASVLIVSSDVVAACSLAEKLRRRQWAMNVMCAHTVQSALMWVAEAKLDAVIIDFGNEGMRGEAIAGTIFIACPVQKPLMIVLSVQAARKGHIGQARIFDHVIKKPPKVRGLAKLVANARL